MGPETHPDAQPPLVPSVPIEKPAETIIVAYSFMSALTPMERQMFEKAIAVDGGRIIGMRLAKGNLA